MAGRRDMLNAEAPQVEDDAAENVHIGFASVAAASAHHAQLEGASEQTEHFLVECLGTLTHASTEDEVFAGPRRQPVFACVSNRSLRAAIDTLASSRSALCIARPRSQATR